MRSGMVVLLLCALVLPLGLFADAAAKKDANAGVRRSDIKPLFKEPPRGDVTKPTVITNDEELAKAFPDKELQIRIKKEVDFSKEKLLYFAWGGSGQDKFAFKGVIKQEVVFIYTPGLTRDLRPHAYLYAVPKDATWTVDTLRR